MITLSQIKAARALLNWTQEKLARVAGLSLPGLNNIERGLASPRKETLSAIETALMSAGIEFIDTSGVRLKTPDLHIETLEGPDWLARYDDDIIACLKTSDDEIIQFSCDEKLWMLHGSATNHHYIDHRNQIGFKERILIPNTSTFVTNKQDVYRTLPAAHFGQISYQVYHDRVAYILWGHRKIILFHCATLADGLRAQYNLLWQAATPITDKTWSALEKWIPQ